MNIGASDDSREREREQEQLRNKRVFVPVPELPCLSCCCVVKFKVVIRL